MGIREILGRLERQAAHNADVCQHMPPIIYHADGSVENDQPHSCDRPRLVINIGYSDGSDDRTKLAAHSAFSKMRGTFKDMPTETVADIVAREFHMTAGELLEGAR